MVKNSMSFSEIEQKSAITRFLYTEQKIFWRKIDDVSY